MASTAFLNVRYPPERHVRKERRKAKVKRLLRLHERLVSWRPRCRSGLVRGLGDVATTSLAGLVLLWAAARALTIR